MPPEQLLKERYILEKLWPGCQWGIGTIFPANFANFKDYPYLFRLLKWYEERKESELPIYVRNVMSGYCFKVKKWTTEYGQLVAYYKIKDGAIKADWLTPIHKEEYEEFKRK
jgi:hypothetical protein